MKARRLPPPPEAAPALRQIWRIVDGAVASALTAHPEYLAAPKRARTVRRSIVKRVAGALHGYAGQPAWVRSGFSPADDVDEPRCGGPARGEAAVSSRAAPPTRSGAGGASRVPPAHGGRP